MAFDFNLALRVGQFLACRCHDLGFDDVHPGDEFGDRMLHLHPGVHFNEIELAVFIQKLKRTSASVAHFFASCCTSFANALDQLAWDAWRRCFFNDFLVAPLHRAITFTQVNGVFIVVGQDLNFDVARVLQKLFHVDRGVAKG